MVLRKLRKLLTAPKAVKEGVSELSRSRKKWKLLVQQ